MMEDGISEFTTIWFIMMSQKKERRERDEREEFDFVDEGKFAFNILLHKKMVVNITSSVRRTCTREDEKDS